MMWEQRVVVPLRICLVVLFGVLLVFQTLSLPGQFRYQAEQHPEDADMRWVLTAIAVFLVLCVQVVVVATWKLLGLVSADRIFTRDSLVWVDVILGAIAAAWLVVLAIFLWVGFHADDPGAPMLLLLILVSGTVLGLLMVVMRALLRQATTLRTDMDAVI
jgi:Protein of unknown function (DUF2975)